MVQVQTFGQFDIKLGEVSVLKRGQRANKNLELLKYLITFKGRKLLPEIIIEDLWKEDEVLDPKSALRSQIFRLRKCLKAVKAFDLACEDGSYILHTSKECFFDADSFEGLIGTADTAEDMDVAQAIDIYSKAIDLYPGHYLAEDPYSEWILPVRNRYHRMYVHAVLHLMEVLKSQGEFGEIIKLYERVFPLEPYEESIHIYFLEALLELNHIKHALSHYKYITDQMFREFSVEPTPALKSVYRRMVSGQDLRSFTDIFFLEQKLLEDDDSSGALLCDEDHFKLIYNLERRKSLRSHQDKYLSLISLAQGNLEISCTERDRTMQLVLKALKAILRKGDVFCRWNPNQIVILFTDMVGENLIQLKRRIKRTLEEIGLKKDGIKIDFHSIDSQAQKTRQRTIL